MLKDLQEKVDQILEDDEDIVPITNEEIDEIMNHLEADWEDNWEYDDSVPYPNNEEGTEESEG